MSSSSATGSLTLPDSSRVLAAAYLEKHGSKNDLLRRLGNIVQVLRDDEDVEAESQDFPGLGGLAAALVQPAFLDHRDKEVRLFTVLACMEIFAIYAPEAPWDEREVLLIFSQMIRQLANLAHCTSPSQPMFSNYLQILQLLAQVKIGVVLVELTKTLDTRERDEAMEMLGELIHTMLSSVRTEHPPEVGEYIQEAITACLEEYDLVPIPILDEILLTVGQGPTIMVTNPAAVEAAAKTANAKKKGVAVPKTKLPPSQLEQANPSYMVAAAVIRKTVDRQSTPIANLLNGLLNGDPHVVDQSSILVSATTEDDSKTASTPFAPKPPPCADVYAIVYELHRISPQVLTTVIGTVSNSLSSLDSSMRLRVVRLLGRLFYAPSSNIAAQFRPCLREWMGRCTDIDSQIRLALAKSLVMMLGNIHESDIIQEVSLCLVQMLDNDPALEVRSLIINSVCDLVYKKTKQPNVSSTGNASKPEESSTAVPARLLQAIGNRVHSKIKSERKDAITGLSQLYFRHYVQPKLQHVRASGDEFDLQLVLEVLHETCDLVKQRNSVTPKKRKPKAASNDTSYDDDDDRFSWIPRKVFECVCYTDAADPEMRNRVIQIVDDVLLGSELSENKKMTPSCRAIGLAFILDSLRENGDDLLTGNANGNACKFMVSLFTQRANLQRALNKYIDARAELKACKPGSDNALMANAKAVDMLEAVATLAAPPLTSGASASDLPSILENLHGAPDKHIFRILATIANPTHTMAARVRAFEELPKRTKSLGDATCAWVKSLARRCAMGDFLNKSIIQQCIAMAQECLRGDDIPAASAFLSCVKAASTIFPSLCGGREGFNQLIEMFMECRAVRSGKQKKEIDKCGIVTALCSILAAGAASRVLDCSDEDEDDKIGFSDDDFQKELTNLCTHDGTAEQARYAVFLKSALLNHGQFVPGTKLEEVATRETQTLGPLVKALSGSARLTLTSSTNEDAQLVSVLTAFAALADCAPSLFSCKAGARALSFAKETVLLGRNDLSKDDKESEPESYDQSQTMEEDEEAATPSSRRVSAGKLKHVTPMAGCFVLDDSTLSIPCRRVCAAIEFLVSFIRAAVLRSIAAGSKASGMSHHLGKENDRKGQKDAPTFSALLPPSADTIQSVFEILVQVLQDNGLPPSERDRKSCNARQDRATIRRAASVHLLRLCDPRLNLERSHLTVGMWHMLGASLLDEERVVRDAVLEELSNLLTAKGKFHHEALFKKPAVPNLRFLALVVLGADSEHGSDNSIANGGAANVGKRSQSTKFAALQCVKALRKACETTLTQCKALGRTQEQNYEKNLKMMLMPEYCVPYAMHLLSFRRETPGAGGTSIAKATGLTQTQNEGEELVANAEDENHHKVLRRRLKLLFEPLVHSLGDSADNISFLLRMSEVLGNYYLPVDSSRESAKHISEASPAFSMNSRDDNVDFIEFEFDEERTLQSAAKLKTACLAAREVLLGFVKKDVNLKSYPGGIQLPLSLFKRSATPASRLGQLNPDHVHPTSLPTLQPISKGGEHTVSDDAANQKSKKTSKKSMERVAKRKSGRVHFSPEVEDDEQDLQYQDFGGVSPIPTSHSPMATGRGAESEEKTIGPTPPSILRTSTSRSGTQESGGDTDRESRSSFLSVNPDQPESDLKSSQRKAEDPSGDQSCQFLEDDDDDHIHTTSETQSSVESSDLLSSPLRSDVRKARKADKNDSVSLSDEIHDDANIPDVARPASDGEPFSRRSRLSAKRLFAEKVPSPTALVAKQNVTSMPTRKSVRQSNATELKAVGASQKDGELEPSPSLDQSTLDVGIPKVIDSNASQSQDTSDIMGSPDEQPQASRGRRAKSNGRTTLSSKATAVVATDEAEPSDEDDSDEDEDVYEPPTGPKPPSRRTKSSKKPSTSRESGKMGKRKSSEKNDEEKKRRKTSSSKVQVSVKRPLTSQLQPETSKVTKGRQIIFTKREPVSEKDEFDFDAEIGGVYSVARIEVGETKGTAKRTKPTKISVSNKRKK